MINHPYTGMPCRLPDGSEGRIVFVGQSVSREGPTVSAFVLTASGTHDEFDLLDIEVDEKEASAALRHYWATVVDMVRHTETRPPLGWRVHGDRREEIDPMPEGEPHPRCPHWRAAVAHDRRPDGWKREDGLHLRAAFNTFEVKKDGEVLLRDEYIPKLPEATEIMRLVDRRLPRGE